MGLSMAEQKAVTWELADRYQRAPKEAKGVMLTRLSRRRAGTVASPGALQDAVPSAARPASDGADSPSCDPVAGEEVLATVSGVGHAGAAVRERLARVLAKTVTACTSTTRINKLPLDPGTAASWSATTCCTAAKSSGSPSPGRSYLTRFERTVGGVFCFCLCASFAFLIASRTTIDDPALVVLTEFGVVFGLEVTEIFVCLDRPETGVVGVEARIEETGVVGRDLEGLNVLFTCIRGRDTEDGICALPRSAETLLVVDFVDFVARAGLRMDSSCRSRARRRVSLVLPERLKDGVCGGMTLAVGGVVVARPDNSLVVPKSRESQARSVV